MKVSDDKCDAIIGHIINNSNFSPIGLLRQYVREWVADLPSDPPAEILAPLTGIGDERMLEAYRQAWEEEALASARLDGETHVIEPPVTSSPRTAAPAESPGTPRAPRQ